MRNHPPPDLGSILDRHLKLTKYFPYTTELKDITKLNNRIIIMVKAGECKILLPSVEDGGFKPRELAVPLWRVW